MKAGNFEIKETAKAVFYNNAGQWISAILQFIFTIILVRELSIADYGIYVIFFGITPFFGLLNYWAFPAVMRYLPEFIARENTTAAKKFVKLALAYSILAGALIIALVLVFPSIFQLVFGDAKFTPELSRLFATILFLHFATSVPLWALNALGHQKSRNLATVAYTVLTIIFSVIALNAGLGLTGVFSAIALSMLVYLFLLSLAVRKKLFSLPDSSKGQITTRKITRYTTVSYLAYFGEMFVMLSVDIALLAFLLGPEQTGLYGFATKIPTMLLNYSPAVLGATVLFPFIVHKYSKNGDKKIFSTFFETYTRFSAFFVTPMVFGGLVLGIPIIKILFSEKYIQTFPLFVVAMAVMGIVSLRSSLQNVYNTLEKPEIGIYSKVFFIFSSSAIILYAKPLGIFAAFCFTAAAMLLMTITEYFLTARLVKLRIPIVSIIKTIACSALMSIALLVAVPLISGLLALAGAVIIGALTYFALSALIKPFEQSDSEIFERAGLLGKALKFFSK